MNNWKVIFATVIIFGAGVITGGLLVNYVQPSHPRAPHKSAAPAEVRTPATTPVGHPLEAAKLRPPEILSKQFLQRLDDGLHLAPEQHEAIQKLINEGQNLMRKVIQDSRLEIRELLTPEQRKSFDELMKRPFRKPIFGTNAPVVLPPATNAPATNAP